MYNKHISGAEQPTVNLAGFWTGQQWKCVQGDVSFINQSYLYRTKRL